MDYYEDHKPRYKELSSSITFKELSSSITFKEMLDEMKAFENLYPSGEDFEVVAEGYRDGEDMSYGELQLRCYSPQTEEEKQQELDEIKRIEERDKEYRRKEYLKLKEEFENEGDVK